MVSAIDGRWRRHAYRHFTGLSRITWLHSRVGRGRKIILRSRQSRHTSRRGRLLKAPNPNHQTPGEHQAPSTKWAHGVWSLVIGASLVLGYWCLGFSLAA